MVDGWSQFECSHSNSGLLSACVKSDWTVGMLLASLEPSQQLDALYEYIREQHWDGYNSDGLQLMQMFPQ
jgi:hypothetical protein